MSKGRPRTKCDSTEEEQQFVGLFFLDNVFCRPTDCRESAVGINKNVNSL